MLKRLLSLLLKGLGWQRLVDGLGGGSCKGCLSRRCWSHWSMGICLEGHQCGKL